MHPVTLPYWAWSCLWIMAAFWPAYLLLLGAGIHRHRHRFVAVDAEVWGQLTPFEKPDSVVTWLCRDPKCPHPETGLITTVHHGRLLLDDLAGRGVRTVPNDWLELRMGASNDQP